MIDDIKSVIGKLKSKREKIKWLNGENQREIKKAERVKKRKVK